MSTVWGSSKSRVGAALGCAIALLTAAAPGAAQARWLKAEGTRFTVYSNGDEGTLRDYARKLETFDALLRMLHKVPNPDAPIRKLPVYLVSTRGQIELVRPGLPETTAGFYTANGEDIFAVARRTDRRDDVLQHEYVHHFMLQYFPHGYPAWVVEGYAEYFMTAETDTRQITFGKHHPNRAAWLFQGRWLPLSEMLARSPHDFERSREMAKFYAQSWLMTHYFMAEEGRRRQLDAYINAVARGAEGGPALEKATGLSLDELDQALKSYAKGQLKYAGLDAGLLPEPRIAVSTLSPAADDLLLLGQRLKTQVAAEDRPAILERVRKAAARHPDDPLAMVTLGHAEAHLGDPAAGEAVLTRLLAREPDHVEALQMLASIRMGAARAQGADRKALMSQARAFLGRAYKADPANYVTLHMLAQTRVGAPGYPTDNDLATWQEAYLLAPQLGSIRIGFAQALMQRGDFDLAASLLETLANSPHRGGASDYAKRLLEAARARRKPSTVDEDDEVDAAA